MRSRRCVSLSTRWTWGYSSNPADRSEILLSGGPLPREPRLAPPPAAPCDGRNVLGEPPGLFEEHTRVLQLRELGLDGHDSVHPDARKVSEALVHKTYPCELAALEFVCLLGDIPISAAHFRHLGRPPGAFGAAFYPYVDDLPGATATAGSAGLSSAFASAHRTSPSLVDNNQTTIPLGDELTEDIKHCLACFALSSVSYSSKKHHSAIMSRLDRGEAGCAPTGWKKWSPMFSKR